MMERSPPRRSAKRLRSMASMRKSRRRGRRDARGGSMSTLEVKVPDIGDFTDVPVIEVFVKPGDNVKPDDSLITLESDKATMDVPAPSAGVVKDLKLKVGDKVSEGSVILTLEARDATAANPPQSTAAAPAPPGEERAAPSPSKEAPSPRAA